MRHILKLRAERINGIEASMVTIDISFTVCYIFTVH